jgi:hypothetical protein
MLNLICHRKCAFSDDISISSPVDINDNHNLNAIQLLINQEYEVIERFGF